MTMLIIQSLLLIATAYILGCLLGGVLRWLFGAQPEVAAPVAVAATASAAAVAPVKEPEPVARIAEPAPKLSLIHI